MHSHFFFWTRGGEKVMIDILKNLLSANSFTGATGAESGESITEHLHVLISEPTDVVALL